jgi:hypothetical protein
MYEGLLIERNEIQYKNEYENRSKKRYPASLSHEDHIIG